MVGRRAQVFVSHLRERQRRHEIQPEQPVGRTPVEALRLRAGPEVLGEHAFHEAKNQLGMAQYQVRVWCGWHLHKSLCCLAMLFLLWEQIRTSTVIPR